MDNKEKTDFLISCANTLDLFHCLEIDCKEDAQQYIDTFREAAEALKKAKKYDTLSIKVNVLKTRIEELLEIGTEDYNDTRQEKNLGIISACKFLLNLIERMEFEDGKN